MDWEAKNGKFPNDFGKFWRLVVGKLGYIFQFLIKFLARLLSASWCGWDVVATLNAPAHFNDPKLQALECNNA